MITFFVWDLKTAVRFYRPRQHAESSYNFGGIRCSWNITYSVYTQERGEK